MDTTSRTAGTDGHIVLRLLRTTAVSPVIWAGPGFGPDASRYQTTIGSASLAADGATTITLQPRPVITPGSATATAPFSGRKTVQVPVTISPPSGVDYVTVPYRTIHVDGAPGN